MRKKKAPDDWESALTAEYDADEAIQELREDVKEAGLCGLFFRLTRPRRKAAPVIRVRGATTKIVQEQIKQLAKAYQGFAWSEQLRGNYLNFYLEFTEPAADKQGEQDEHSVGTVGEEISE